MNTYEYSVMEVGKKNGKKRKKMKKKKTPTGLVCALFHISECRETIPMINATEIGRKLFRWIQSTQPNI